MSERQGSTDSEPGATEKSAAIEHAPGTPKSRRSAATIVAVLALLVSLLAAGGLVWIWLEQAEQEPSDLASTDDLEVLRSAQDEQGLRLDDQGERLTSLSDELDGLAGELADLRQSQREHSSDTDDIRRQLADLEAELGEAVSRLEETAGDQRAVDRELARRLYLMEAAALLRGGQERAELAGDHSGARAAYRRAYRLMRDADDPRGSRARGLVAQELEALEDMAEPDWTAMDAQIDRLAASVDQWPAAGATASSMVEHGEEEADSRWWSRMTSTLAGLVRVQPRDSIAITAEELDVVREQLRLRLAAVELALARRDLEESSRQLRRVEEVVERWFDTGEASVQRGLAMLADLAAIEPAQLPSMGAALAEIDRLLEDS